MRKSVLLLLFNCILLPTHSQWIKIKEPVNFLALGDSYTIGQGVSQSESWPFQLSDSLMLSGFQVENVKVIARSGWRTDNLIFAMEAEKLRSDYNLVSLLIGVNNQFLGLSLNQYKEEFTFLLNDAIRLAQGDTNSVFVVSIPDYGFTPFGESNQQNITKEIDEFNRANRSIADDFGVMYIDITPISRNGLVYPELVANDELHPSGKMYSQWVSSIMDAIRINNGNNNGSTIIVNPGSDPELDTELSNGNTFSEFMIYPNPVEGELTIISKGIKSYRIINFTGVEVVNKQIVSDRLQVVVDVRSIPRGLYLVELTASDNKKYIERVIKL